MDLNQEIKEFYHSQLAVWEMANQNKTLLSQAEEKVFFFEDYQIKTQFNPARIISSSAKVDTSSLQKRPCFLCKENRPAVQEAYVYNERLEILLNPFPILPYHLTIAERRHTAQAFLPYLTDALDLAKDLDDFIFFYNGPKSGASAPDHMHFQAVEKGHLPLEKEYLVLKKQEQAKYNYQEGKVYHFTSYLRTCFFLEAEKKETLISIFEKLYKDLSIGSEEEPMMNVFFQYVDNKYHVFLFPRQAHRPKQYYLTGENHWLVSPGAIDMAGILVLSRKEDFLRINKEMLIDIFSQVSLQEVEPKIEVGILSAKTIDIELKSVFLDNLANTYTGSLQATARGDKVILNESIFDELSLVPTEATAVFELKNVLIGIGFHWERKENQSFQGSLKLIAKEDKLIAINIVSVEAYLMSVISSEMSAKAPLEYLKAHALISRSWLLANQKSRENLLAQNSETVFVADDETYIRWYEREAHTDFDVCADDHCQRYQGITKASTSQAETAVLSTRGEVLMWKNEICDARFSKSCGGMTEKFETCWADTSFPYLTALQDRKEDQKEANLDLSIEAQADKWIRSTPPAFCQADNQEILAQVLNDYDQETQDFYRWTVRYTAEELRQIIQQKSGQDLGDILNLKPLKRGSSGRIYLLEIEGSKKTIRIGKELEIRKWLSPSHLYSSAFVVDKRVDEQGKILEFIIRGAGWGHGVGLCQIGAACMSQQAYTYQEILWHYYPQTEIKKIY